MAKKRVKRPSSENIIPVPDIAPVSEFNIVGVGGSAGGFEAFAQLLRGVPAKPNIAIIFVQHLAPHHGSALSTLLTNYTDLRVVQASEGARIVPDTVYVVPPNAQMQLVGNHLHLGPRPTDITQYTPIDFFFRSLAKTLRQDSIGVVLSGTASDGALGVREIKAMGGTTIAQDPSTAKYEGMPRAAIATQAVDLVLAPPDIGPKLVEIARSPVFGARFPDTREDTDRLSAVTEDQLDRVFKRLIPKSGIDFAHYKTPTIIRRLLRRATLLRLPDVDSYIEYLEQTPEEVVKLHADLLIHVTRFFREPESFEVLARDVLPKLELKPDTPIRAWVAGCATGEEVYSLAIVMQETLGGRIDKGRVQIFGTDVSETAVEYARQGFYPPAIAADVSPERLKRFFVKTDGGYRIEKTLRDMCVFARQDLTRDPPFSRLDLVCCRNVLIYMNNSLQRKLLSTFHYALKPSGILLLGQAESIGYQSDLFNLMDKKHRMFRKKPGATPSEGRIGVSLPASRLDDVTQRAAGVGLSTSRLVVNEANRIVIDRFAPPSVLIDQNFHVVQFNGQTGFFLEPSPGEPSFHVLKLAREGLLHGLRSALQTVRKTRRTARREALRVRSGSTWREVNLEVIPLTHQSQTFYLVLFEPADKKLKQKTLRSLPQRKTRKGAGRVAQLEAELAATREYLQSTIQEIEAANEELQSANEEILSSNEELQSTNEELDTAKEELQSINEELNTVNDELYDRNEDLTRANADLLNVLASVRIAIVIVSRDMRIRLFTPIAGKLFNLINGDTGRPFSQISPNIESPNLSKLLAETLEKMVPIESHVEDKDGQKYLMRIRPYRNADNRVEGAVIAMFDLETPKKG